MGEPRNPDDDIQAVDQSTVTERAAFAHKFFTATEGAYFRLDETTGAPGLVVDIGGNEATLSFAGIRRELELAEDDPDSQMLDRVAEALQYVRVLPVGGLLPSEILTGDASWSIEGRHRLVARQRLMLQLVGWMSHEEVVITDTDALVQIAEDPKTKEKINSAFGEAAEAIGIGRARKDEVVDLVDHLAEELAYIEALRDMIDHVRLIRKYVTSLEPRYAQDRHVGGIIRAVLRLIGVPIADYRNVIEQIDAQTGEIVAVLKNIDAQIAFIRETRDDLHRRLMAWQELVGKWTEINMKKSHEVEALLEETYHFLAMRFLEGDTWTLMSQLGGGKTKKSSEVLW